MLDQDHEPNFDKIKQFWSTEKDLSSIEKLKNYERNMWKNGYICSIN